MIRCNHPCALFDISTLSVTVSTGWVGVWFMECDLETLQQKRQHHKYLPRKPSAHTRDGTRSSLQQGGQRTLKTVVIVCHHWMYGNVCSHHSPFAVLLRCVRTRRVPSSRLLVTTTRITFAFQKMHVFRSLGSYERVSPLLRKEWYDG